MYKGWVTPYNNYCKLTFYGQTTIDYVYHSVLHTKYTNTNLSY